MRREGRARVVIKYSLMRGHFRPSEPLFTVQELSALLDLPERKLRKEIELGLMASTSPPRLSFEDAVCLAALGRFSELELTTDGRKHLYKLIRSALDHRWPSSEIDDVVTADGFLQVKVGRLATDVRSCYDSFRSWKERRVVSDPDVLGGEPVFKGSRLSVRHIGGLPTSERAGVLEDYPYLTEEDIRFAGVFSRAYPRMGRPRESTEAPRR
jgi:uncharacterized protein (DUF433 family)